MYILFDIGGTKSRFAASNDGLSFDEPIIIDTPQNYSEGILAFDDCVRKITRGKKIDKAVGGFPGTLIDQKVFKSPNLPDYEGKFLGYELERVFGVKPFIENDAYRKAFELFFMPAGWLKTYRYPSPAYLLPEIRNVVCGR